MPLWRPLRSFCASGSDASTAWIQVILGLVYAMINALGSQLGAVRFRVPVRVAMTQTKRPAHAGEVNADSIRLPREVRTMSAWCS